MAFESYQSQIAPNYSESAAIGARAQQQKGQAILQTISSFNQAAAGLVQAAQGQEQYDKAVGTKEGAKVAQEDIAAGKIQLREKQESYEDKEYNRLVSAAYRNNAERESVNQLNMLAQENFNNPTAYLEQADVYIKSVVDSAPTPELKALLQTQLKDKAQAQLGQLSLEAKQREQTVAKIEIMDGLESKTDEIVNNARYGDVNLAGKQYAMLSEEIKSMVLSGDITPSQGAKLLDETEQRVQIQGQLGEFEDLMKSNPSGAQNYIDSIKDKGLEGMAPETVDRLANSMQADLNSYNARVRAANKENVKLQKEQEKMLAAYQHVGLNVEAGLVLDYKNEQDKKAVNMVFNDQIDTVDVNSPEGRAIVTDFVEKTGVVPEKVKGMIRVGLYSGNPEQVQVSVGLINQMVDNKPELLNQMSKEDVNFAIGVNSQIEMGIPAEQAIERQQKMAKIDVPTRTKEVNSQWESTKDFNKEVNSITEDFISENYDAGWFSKNPQAVPQMKTEMSKLIKDNMVLNGGNKEAAIKLAQKQMSNKWGSTSSTDIVVDEYDDKAKVFKGGKAEGKLTMTPYPPERVFDPNGDGEWVRNQYLSDLQELNKTDGDNKKRQFSLSPDMQSMNTNPRYMVMEKDEYGNQTPYLNKEGKPVYWKADYKKTEQYVEQQKLNQSKLELAQEEQQRTIKHRNFKRKLAEDRELIRQGRDARRLKKKKEAEDYTKKIMGN